MLEQVYLIGDGKRIVNNEKGKKQLHKKHVKEKEDRLMITMMMMVIITVMAIT